jgi:hypothetical protein
MRIAIIAVVTLVAGAAARAAPAHRNFTVMITPGAPDARWRADAITAALERDLADDRLAFVAVTCAPGCADDTLRAAGVELAVRGTADDLALAWQVTPLWPGAPAPVRGVLAFGGVTRATLAAALRDPMHRLVRAQTDEDAIGAVAPPGMSGVLVAIALAAGLLALPFVVAIARGRGARRVLGLRALRSTAGVVIVTAGAAIALVAWGEAGPWLAAGGLAWGALATVLLPFALPPIVGLGRAFHHELGGVLRAWLAAALARTLALAVLCAPVVAATWLACDAAGVDPTLRLALAVPLALLVARQLVRATVAVLALGLDDALVERSPDTDAWSDAARAYLVGYLRRTGLPVDDELLGRVQLLPGRDVDVAVYGGGLDDARIVIPRPMLELALSPWGRPHDYAAPRISTLHWTMWNAGLVMASAPDAPVATREQRRPREVTHAEGEADTAHEEETERLLIGEPPTLAGVIEPTAFDPRTSYRPHEDPMWLDWDPVEEYDGTDAGDRDFLFGVIVHALGRVQRHEVGAATIALALSRTRRGAWLARARGRLPAGLADLHAHLGGAGPHLVQYLAWRLWRREDLLTARAYAPELDAAARRATAALARDPAGDPRLRQRLAALGARVRGEALPRPRWRRFAIAGALAAAAGALALALADAVRYHATYVERMERATSEKTHGQE